MKRLILNNIQNRLSNEDSRIEDIWFIRSDDGADNCCIQVKGYSKPMRGRSACICLYIDEDDIYILSKPNEDDYGVPGGGWDKNESPKEAAIRELHEETLFDITRVQRMGTLIEYHDQVKDWVEEHVDNPEDWWYGYYSAIFVGLYNGDFNGKVDEIDREYSYRWISLDSIRSQLPKEYVDAIYKYLRINRI